MFVRSYIDIDKDVDIDIDMYGVSPSAAGPLDSLVAKRFGGLVVEWPGEGVEIAGGG